MSIAMKSPNRGAVLRLDRTSGDAQLQRRITEYLKKRSLDIVEISIDDGVVEISGWVASAHQRNIVRLNVARAAGGAYRIVDQTKIASLTEVSKSALKNAAGAGQRAAGLVAAVPRAGWLTVAMLFLGTLVPVGLFSCGGPTEKKVPVFPVTGKVSFQGQAAEGAQVILHPQGHTLPERHAAIGTVKKDGSFAVSIYGAGEGITPGDYVATLQWNKVNEAGSPGPNVLPPEYAKVETSPIKVTVKSGRNELPPIEINQN
jgi:hypothetical protein